MATLETPKTWIPYVNSKDCSQGFCSLYCPQWCYIIFPPPPPPFDEFPDDINSTPTFSPLIIAIIGILASAFLLVSYYTIISKYCGNTARNNINDSAIRRSRENHEDDDDENQNPSLHEPWQVSATGLDEALIKRITMCKYKKGDGLIEGTDCSVCLNEFQEDESLRLMPKCSHAFHVSCIDTWLKSHSNCPLCRANIVFITPSLPPPVDGPQSSVQEGSPSVSDEEIVAMQNDPTTPRSDTVIQINVDEGQEKRIRRSFSMDHPCFQSRASIADMLRMDDDDDDELSSEECGSSVEVKKSGGGGRRKRRGVTSPVSVSMKRSFSSGRFFVSGRPGRVRDSNSVSICLV